MSDLYQSILDIGNESYGIINDTFVNIFGLLTKVYFPVVTTSVYESIDSSYYYRNEPDLEKEFLYNNIVVERKRHQVSVDTYLDDPMFVYMKADEHIPESSKLDIRINEKFIFKCKLDRYITLTGNDNFIYKKGQLIPMNFKTKG